MPVALPSTSTSPTPEPASHTTATGLTTLDSKPTLPPSTPPMFTSLYTSAHPSSAKPYPPVPKTQLPRPPSTSYSPPTHIHNLPDEILTHIFDRPDIANETLFNVSLSSKRLHLFALPLFLSRFGIEDPVRHSLILFQNQVQSSDQGGGGGLTQPSSSLSSSSSAVAGLYGLNGTGVVTTGADGMGSAAGVNGHVSGGGYAVNGPSSTNTSPGPAGPSIPSTSRTHPLPPQGPNPHPRRRRQLDALTGLRLSLYVTRIERLACRFEKVPDENQELDVMLGRFDRLFGLVTRLESISRVLLVFDNEHCCCCGGDGGAGTRATETANGASTTTSGVDISLSPPPTPGAPASRHRPPSSQGLDEPLQEWTMMFGKLLNELMKKGCEELIIQNGRYMAHAYSFKAGKEGPAEKAVTTPKTLRVIKSFFGRKPQDQRQRSSSGSTVEAESEKDEEVPLNVLGGDLWAFQRTKGTGEATLLTQLDPSLKTSTSFKLSKLTIQSMMFVFPPLLHWTISVMKYAPLRSLTLANLSINRKCWPVLFNLIADAAPHLMEIRLMRLRLVAPAELSHFLSRLANLKSLHIGRDVDCFDSYDLPILPDFPQLVSLYAPAAWVFKLLSSQRTGMSRLENLTIVYHLRNDGFSHWLRKSTTPSIPILLKEQRRPLTLALEVVLGNSPGWRMSEDVNHLLHPRHQPQPKSTLSACTSKCNDSLPFCDDDVVDAVTSLTLIVDQELKKGDLSLGSVLPRWLSLFYGLRQLAIRSHPKAMSEPEVMTLVKRVVDAGALAAVSNVEVNGLEVDVEYGMARTTELDSTTLLPKKQATLNGATA